jgi:hypothetical protein
MLAIQPSYGPQLPRRTWGRSRGREIVAMSQWQRRKEEASGNQFLFYRDRDEHYNLDTMLMW